MIRSVEITNFKNIRHQRIELEPLTVFVGANASGKTSVLQAIALAIRAEPIPPIGPFGIATGEGLLARHSTGGLRVVCTTDSGEFSVSQNPTWAFEASTAAGDPTEAALEAAGKLTFLRPDPAELAEPSFSELAVPRMEANGRGLATALAYLSRCVPDEFESLNREMCGLVPGLRRVHVAKVPVLRIQQKPARFKSEPMECDAILFDFENATDVGAHGAGEGTLVLLGLLTVLLGPHRPSVLLLDGIDRGLHPGTQISLIQVLTKLMDTFPDLQLLATTHSPYLADALAPEQLRLMTAGPNGDAICGRLTDHPDFEEWRHRLSPGEMWSIFGETWLAEARAT